LLERGILVVLQGSAFQGLIYAVKIRLQDGICKIWVIISGFPSSFVSVLCVLDLR